MKKLTHLSITTFVATASLCAQNAFPLPSSAGNTTTTQDTAPFVVPTRVKQTRITDRNTLMAAGLAASLDNWDMATFDPSGRYVFVPCENFGGGGGVFRYDTLTGTHVEIWRGNGSGVNTRNGDPATFDPATDETAANDPCSFTPWNTIIFGEEATGGRLFECTNPLSPTGPFHIVWHGSIPSMAHEGMRFDSAGNLYIIDENNSGSIYKFVPTTPGDLSQGQTFVLSIDGYAAHPNAAPHENFNSASNQIAPRIGPATWVPLTGPQGQQITVADPYAFVTTTGARTAADELVGTPFGRPEDLDIGTLANGNECIYVALTSENRILGIELLTATTCVVRDFVNYDTINLATGSDVNPAQGSPYQGSGSGTRLNSPDNIAIDAFGNVYITEDSTPSDTWLAIDADRDGVAEAIGIFFTLGVAGSEATGTFFDPNDPYRLIVNIQHPANGNDALWSIETRPYPGSAQDLQMLTGVDTFPSMAPGQFVRDVQALDTYVVKVDSLNATYYGDPFAVLIQPFDTSIGQPAFLPPLWMSPFGPTWVLVGGLVGQFPTALPFGGSSSAVIVPPGLAGLSIMVQGIVVDAEGRLVLTDGNEVVFK